MIEENWSGQQDLNLRQPIVIAKGDSDKGGRSAANTRPKPGCDSDIAPPPGVTHDAFLELLIESGHASRPRPVESHPVLNTAITEAMIESLGHPDTINVGEDDPLLAKLRKGKR